MSTSRHILSFIVIIEPSFAKRHAQNDMRMSLSDTMFRQAKTTRQHTCEEILRHDLLRHRAGSEMFFPSEIV